MEKKVSLVEIAPLLERECGFVRMFDLSDGQTGFLFLPKDGHEDEFYAVTKIFESNYITLDDYRNLVEEIGGDNINELYTKGYKLACQNKHYLSLPFMEKVSRLGNIEASYYLGQLYENGVGVPQDIDRAIEYYKLCEKENHIEAIFNLAAIYDFGKGGHQDYSIAYSYYKRAGVKGTYMLGIWYRDGIYVKQNLDTAMSLIQSCYNQGLKIAANNLGHLYYNKGEYSKALELFKEAEKNGDILGTLNIGWMYIHGYAVPKNYHKALELFRKGALVNNAEAFYDLGCVYENGLGVKRDKVKALNFFKYSMKLGYTQSLEKIKELGQSNSDDLKFENLIDSIIQEQVKNSISDIVSYAIDKMIDEEGSVIGDAIGNVVAEVIVNSLSDQ